MNIQPPAYIGGRHRVFIQNKTGEGIENKAGGTNKTISRYKLKNK